MNPGQRTAQGRMGASEPEDYILVIERLIDEMDVLKSEIIALKSGLKEPSSGGGNQQRNIAENKTFEKVPHDGVHDGKAPPL